MRRFFVILFAVAICNVRCDESEDLECKGVTQTSPTRRLKDHLFCEYDSSVRPTLTTTDVTIVDVRMLPNYVEFSEQQNTLDFHTWLSLTWPDAHLTWEPSAWDNVKEIHVKSYEIWKPELMVVNTGDLTADSEMRYVDCLLTFNGTVKCVLPTKYTSHCPTDYSEWPYDKHNCSIEIGAWVFYHYEIVFKFDIDSIMMHKFIQNKQWNVHIEHGQPDYFARSGEEGDLAIHITVLLQRHGSRLALMYILPAFVLMVLTLIVLWLDSQSLERILVACINFICHILGLFDLHWYFPATGGQTTPKILIFYEISIALAAMALVLTCLLRKIRETSVPAPMWLLSGTTFILNSPIGTLLKLNVMDHKKDAGILEDNETNGQIPENKKDRTWQELAIIIEWFSFVIVFFIYLIILIVILPPGSPKTQRMTYWL